MDKDDRDISEEDRVPPEEVAHVGLLAVTGETVVLSLTYRTVLERRSVIASLDERINRRFVVGISGGEEEGG